jgi:hypothetical protein
MNRREFLKAIGKCALISSSLLSSCGPNSFPPRNNKNVKENLPAYLMISSDALYDSAEGMASFRKKEYNVEHLKISDISHKPDNRFIRDFLRDYASAYPDLKYVLFVGDAEKIPAFFLEGGIPTDFYYSNIISGGELPDITIGRIPCNDQHDLEVIIEKIKSSEPIVLRKALLFGHGAEIEYYGVKHEELLNSEGYEAYLAKKEQSQTADLQTLISKINEGTDAAIYYGHADLQFMYPFYAKNLPDFKCAPFILLSGGCNNMDFTRECIGYEFLKQLKGSIASIGATKKGGYGFRYSFIEGFFNNKTTPTELGEMFMQGLIHEYKKSIEAGASTEFTKRVALLGDPALKICML